MGEQLLAHLKEANVALQQVMIDYAGPVRSETMLAAGLSYVRRLKEKFTKGVVAQNRWELTRCLETRNLLDLGEMVFLAANERKETRGMHNRSDHVLTNPMLDEKVICVRRVNGKPVMEWKKIG